MLRGQGAEAMGAEAVGAVRWVVQGAEAVGVPTKEMGPHGLGAQVGLPMTLVPTVHSCVRGHAGETGIRFVPV